MATVAVIGAGVMGLSAAWHAVRAGHTVEVFEAGPVAGGMAAHFDFDGLSLERYYHFVCKADRHSFNMLAELGLSERLVWRPTTMGYFVEGQHHPWGDPFSLLRLPLLGLGDKLRYGLQMWLSTLRSRPGALENLSAEEWLRSAVGPRAYDLLWRRLLELKFHELASEVSAAWMWTRIKRVGTSRRSLFQEELGYLEGGSETLVRALVAGIEDLGGKLHLGQPVTEVVTESGEVRGVRTPDGGTRRYDQIISTVPTPLVPEMVPGLPDADKAAYAAIRNIAVVCVVLKLRRPVTPHFWLNVNDSSMLIPGLVEFSNLRPLPDPVVYVPYYMPTTHPRFGRADADFIAESVGYLCRINPDVSASDVLATQVGRLRHAQPVCPPGFAARLPKVMTSIRGLQIADTCFYYPEDRGVSESLRYGQLLATGLTEREIWDQEAR